MMERNSRKTRGGASGINMENLLAKRVSSKIRLHSSPSGKTLLAGDNIEKNELLAVYTGKITSEPPEQERYLYGIEHEKKLIWINAANENNIIKYIKNEKKRCNTRVKKVLINGHPYPLFYATTSIKMGEEIFGWFGYPEDRNWKGLESKPMVDRPSRAVVQKKRFKSTPRVDHHSPDLRRPQQLEDDSVDQEFDEETSRTRSHVVLTDDKIDEESTSDSTDSKKSSEVTKKKERFKSTPRGDHQSLDVRRPQQLEDDSVDKEFDEETSRTRSHVALTDDHGKKESTRKRKRPLRPCLFCSELKSRLPRHYETVHGDEPEIKRIKKMTPKKRVQEYGLLRIQGIYDHNVRELGKKSPRLQTERTLTPSKKIVSCAVCKKFVQARTFYSHACSKKKSKHSAIPVECITTDENSKKFNVEILKQIRNDKVEEFAKSNETVKLFGIRLFRRLKNAEKKTEQRHSVMTHMQKLTQTFFEFQSAAAKAGKEVEAGSLHSVERAYLRWRRL